MRSLTAGPSWRLWCQHAPKKRAAAMPDEWPQVRSAILQALAGFPEARAAVAAAIRKFVAEDEE